MGIPCLDEPGGIPGGVMDIYNHSSYEVTKRYLGVAQDDLNKAYLGMELLQQIQADNHLHYREVPRIAKPFLYLHRKFEHKHKQC